MSSEDVLAFKKGEEKDILGMKVKFVDFDRSKFNRDEMTSGKQNIMGAELEVTIDGKTEKVIVEQEISEQGTVPIPVMMKGSDKFSFHLIKLSVAGESTVDVAILDESKPKNETPETLVLTASIKPFINFVWGGTIVMVIGFFLALMARYRRIKSESRKVTAMHTSGTLSGGNGSQKQGSKHHKEHTHKN